MFEDNTYVQYLDFRFLEVVLEGGGWGDGDGELCISYVFILHRCIQSFTLHFLPKKSNLFWQFADS